MAWLVWKAIIFFQKNCMKLKEFGPIGEPEPGAPSPVTMTSTRDVYAFHEVRFRLFSSTYETSVIEITVMTAG